ncbi:tetratricopeptide repeat protein [Paludibacterium denitrificans]|uniref:Tetratricopeptide repeat protein n=1 Tax=Paludibacterium denitrificans TaxID=2675226 RepID=A0A844GCS0_9NEIS|nr:tetratricopeptide repeat protein [Paludibacterium denitrificans]MTD33028.1 tetratricopeptide repeat protein [Paludibacterium denitrificans]
MSGMNEQLAISQLNRALSLLQHGQPAAAKPILLKVRQAFPDSPQLYFALGLACAALLQNEAALEHFAKAIELAPTFAAAYINQGVLLKKMGQPAKAIACYNQGDGVATGFGLGIEQPWQRLSDVASGG